MKIFSLSLFVLLAGFGNSLSETLSEIYFRQNTPAVPGRVFSVSLMWRSLDSVDIRLPGEVQFHIAFRGDLLSPRDIFIDSRWSDLGANGLQFIQRYPDSPRCNTATLWVKVSGPDSGWFSDTSSVDTMPLIDIFFLVDSLALSVDSSLALDFCWQKCDDNTVLDSKSDTLWLAGIVVDHRAVDITDSSVSLPSVQGPDFFCLDSIAASTLDVNYCLRFKNAVFEIVDPQAAGAVGDIDFDGHAFGEGDLDLLAKYFHYGRQVYVVDSTAQMAAADVDGDGVSGTIADYALIRYDLLGEILPPTSGTDSSPSWYDYETMFGRTDVFVNSIRSIGAYCISFTITGGIVDSVRAIEPAPPGPFGGARTFIDSTHTTIVWAGGTSDSPIYQPGRQHLLTVFHSGTDLVPLGEQAASVDLALLISNISTSVEPERPVQTRLLPGSFRLRQNYPNPFNPATTIEIDFHYPSTWNLEIMNTLGQRVRSYVGKNPARKIRIVWDGRSESGAELVSGIYFYRLTVGDQTQTRRMVLLK